MGDNGVTAGVAVGDNGVTVGDNGVAVGDNGVTVGDSGGTMKVTLGVTVGMAG